MFDILLLIGEQDLYHCKHGETKPCFQSFKAKISAYATVEENSAQSNNKYTQFLSKCEVIIHSLEY